MLRKTLRRFVAITMITAIVLAFTGCGKKKDPAETPFFEKYSFELVDKDKTYELPLYFYSEDGSGNPIEIEGLEFIPHKMRYKFTNWNVTEPDEDGNVILSYTYTAEATLEYRLPKTNTIEWYYNYSSNNPFAFDYYTGEIYRNTTVGNSSKTVINGVEQVEIEMQLTDVVWNGKTTRIAQISEYTFDGWKDPEEVEDEDGYYHFKTPISATTTTKIKMPKDYDGVMIAINKNGTTKEYFDKDYEKLLKYEELQKQAEETGKKSEEQVRIENDRKMVHKLIDSNDEERKDMKVEDYYVIKVSDIIK